MNSPNPETVTRKEIAFHIGCHEITVHHNETRWGLVKCIKGSRICKPRLYWKKMVNETLLAGKIITEPMK